MIRCGARPGQPLGHPGFGEGGEPVEQVGAVGVGVYHVDAHGAPVAERPALRARLLAPVMEHDQAITDLIRARRRVKDVHPETGQPEE